MANSSLYYKIFEYYKKMILTNQMQSGQKMPTEQEVCEIFNVSRITARHAFELLANQGLIVKAQGKGTFISEKKADMQLNVLQGFSLEMASIGKEPSTIFLNIQLTVPSRKIASKLDLSESSKIYILERIRCADGVKMAYEKVHLPFYLIPDLEKHDLTKSLYAILSSKYQIEPYKASQTIEATLAYQKQAEMLEVKVNSPLLAVERLTYNKNNRPYEFTESLYRGDKYKFSVTMEN